MLFFVGAGLCAMALVVFVASTWWKERRDHHQVIEALMERARERITVAPAPVAARRNREADIEARMAALEAKLFKAQS